MSWLTDPEEAAKHPRRRLAAFFVAGFLLFGYIAYRILDWGPIGGLVVGACFGATLALAEGRRMRAPDWVDRARARQASRPALGKAVLRLAIPFILLALAFVVGAATSSTEVFTIAVVVGLIAGLAVRFTVLR